MSALPASPAPASQPWWLPAGSPPVAVSGYQLRGGLFYLGVGLRSVTGHGPEPALIDPTAEVRAPGAGKATGLSYAKLSPAGRGAYLQWLASGRQQPTAPGNVLLFISGLERRLLVDLRREGSEAEYAAIAAELARLRHVYAHHPAVDRHASGLLTIAQTLSAVRSDSLDPPAPADVAPPELPPALRVGVARFIAAGVGVPVDWAYSWHSHHPGRGWRAPATRCPDEFASLFGLRFKETFGADGMPINESAAELAVSYAPVSPGFGGQRVVVRTGLPDIAQMVTGPAALRMLADRAQAELEPYSRFLGTKPQARGTAEAFALLPAGVTRPSTPDLRRLTEWASAAFAEPASDFVLVARAQLATLLPTGAAPDLALALALDRRGLAIEPDARFTVDDMDERIVFRRTTPASARPGPGYLPAAALLRLAVTVGVTDLSGLQWQLGDSLALADIDRRRLHARGLLLMRQPPRVAGVVAALAGLDPRARGAAADLLIMLAGPAETALLARIFHLLGLDESDLHRRVRALGEYATDVATVRRRAAESTDLAARLLATPDGAAESERAAS
ncbi:TerB N-terminal domain-containing protein [Luedemannella helvata]|uniref:TerB N-terminal domain-containing protein n=1 Tax=Luedemannella helvata TaxID=349315 RepID=A0ABP4VTK0_9ACTN